MPRRATGGKGTLTATLLAEGLKIMALLEAKELTIAELSEKTKIPVRRMYRLLGSMKEAGIKIAERPDPRRSPLEGRVPVVYRIAKRKR